jgi:hypothetical protein
MEYVLVSTKPKGHNDKMTAEMMQERENLIRILDEAGIANKPVNVDWIRNYFVNKQGNILARKKYEFYADGGYILTNPKFTLACADVNIVDNKVIHNTEERAKILNLLYKNCFILPSPDLTLNDSMSPHIDLVVLPIYEKNLLFVDSFYYNNLAKESINNLVNKYSLKLELLYNDYSCPSYPCNSLTLRNGGDISIIACEKGNDAFFSKLKEYGIRRIPVPFSTNCAAGGSIHCATNLLPEKELGKLEEVLQIE